jgi:hypothetical protein
MIDILPFCNLGGCILFGGWKNPNLYQKTPPFIYLVGIALELSPIKNKFLSK